MQKVSIPEDSSRKISSPSNNSYVLEGVDPHQTTQVAPPALLQPFSEELEQNISSRYKSVEEELKSHLGEPFYSDSGFILYQGDSTLLLDRLSNTNLEIDLAITSPPYNINCVWIIGFDCYAIHHKENSKHSCPHGDENSGNSQFDNGY